MVSSMSLSSPATGTASTHATPTPIATNAPRLDRDGERIMRPPCAARASLLHRAPLPELPGPLVRRVLTRLQDLLRFGGIQILHRRAQPQRLELDARVQVEVNAAADREGKPGTDHRDA